jgi:hypothetical protein
MLIVGRPFTGNGKQLVNGPANEKEPSQQINLQVHN